MMLEEEGGGTAGGIGSSAQWMISPWSLRLVSLRSLRATGGRVNSRVVDGVEGPGTMRVRIR
jgi:hypothetical protein